MNNNGYQPIRRYKESGKSSSNKYFLIIIVTALIVSGLMLFIMSLTGTGMFAPEKKGPAVDTDGDDTTTVDVTTEADVTEEETTAPVPDGDIVYTTVEKTIGDTGYGNLILVDDKHEYRNIGKVGLKNVYDYRDGPYKLSGTNLYLTAETIDALNKMFTNFYKDNEFGDCMVYGAYRNLETQTKLYEKNPATAARPGCSDYHTGTSFLLCVIPIDGLIYDFSTSQFAPLGWITGHAHEYGMIFRYPFDKKSITGYDIAGQMRYVGIAHSTYMLENDLCLEEYLKLLAEEYKYEGKHLTVACADGFNYESYYVSAPKEGSVRVPVPENRDYTISGDNCGGFIVTVKIGVNNNTVDGSVTTSTDVPETAEDTVTPETSADGE